MLFLFYPKLFHQRLVRNDIHRLMGGIDHHAGPGAGGLFHIFHQRIVHGDIAALPGPGVIGRQLRRLHDGIIVRRLTAGTEDDMGTVDLLGMEPQVSVVAVS